MVWGATASESGLSAQGLGQHRNRLRVPNRNQRRDDLATGEAFEVLVFQGFDQGWDSLRVSDVSEGKRGPNLHTRVQIFILAGLD